MIIIKLCTAIKEMICQLPLLQTLPEIGLDWIFFVGLIGNKWKVNAGHFVASFSFFWECTMKFFLFSGLLTFAWFSVSIF